MYTHTYIEYKVSGKTKFHTNFKIMTFYAHTGSTTHHTNMTTLTACSVMYTYTQVLISCKATGHGQGRQSEVARGTGRNLCSSLHSQPTVALREPGP